MKPFTSSYVPIQDTVAFRMYRSSRLVRHLHYMTFQQSGFDLTPEQWFILNKLAVRSPQSQTELGESIMDDRPNMTRILLTLEKKGWISRRTDEKDRRKSEVQLTDEGSHVLDACLPAAVRARDQLRNAISDEEMLVFWRVLDKLDHNIEGIIRNSPSREEQ
jgi:MarR family transcriptional regulator, transcriptional regulator for hemolysin